MSNSHLGSGLRGRRTERAVLGQLLAEARAGHNQVLVLRGEARAGQTALLDYLHEGCASVPRVPREDSLGIPTEAIPADERDSGAIGRENA